MKTILLRLILILCLLTISVSLGACSKKLELSPEYVKETMDAFLAVRPAEFPQGLTDWIYRDAPFPDLEFDINSYFSVFKHLSMEPGYILDYVYYCSSSFQGYPIIYVRKADQPPYASHEELRADKEAQSEDSDILGFVSIVMGGETGAFRDHILLDGTPESYFEYVVLNMMGGQFYLFWHANYDDATLIYNEEFLQAFMSGGNIVNEPYPENLLRKARYLDFTPTISYQEGRVSVTVIFFTNWGGFIKSTISMNDTSPHAITDIKNHTIIRYYCGVTF